MNALPQKRVRPWSNVTGSLETEGRVSIFWSNSRTARYWELNLTCGHTVSRLIRKRRFAVAGDRLIRRRDLPDLPPPRRVRCEQCPAEPNGAIHD
jgi:hypothetical protein